MTLDLTNRLLLAGASIVALVAIADAAIDRNWDVVVMVGLVLAFLLALWARSSWGRAAVPIRHDLVRWLKERAVAGGESVEQVAERAIGAYRVGLVGVDPDEDHD